MMHTWLNITSSLVNGLLSMALIVDSDSEDQRLREDAPLTSPPPALVMRISRKTTVGNEALCVFYRYSIVFIQTRACRFRK